MTKLFSPPRLAMLLAISCLTLTACASSPPNSPAGVTTSTVVTQTKVVTQMVCPTELDQVAPAEPQVAADAVVTANASGAAYVTGLKEWGRSSVKLFTDAQAACKAATASPVTVPALPDTSALAKGGVNP